MALTLKASDVPGVLAALEREIDDAKTEAQSAVHVFQEAESIDMRSGDDMQEKLSSLKASLKDVVDWSQSDAGLAIIATRAQKERDGLDQRLQGLNASISLVEVICDLDACFDTMDSAVEVSYLQVYNEQVEDLLKKGAAVNIDREEWYRVQVCSFEEALLLLKVGEGRRVYG